MYVISYNITQLEILLLFNCYEQSPFSKFFFIIINSKCCFLKSIGNSNYKQMNINLLIFTFVHCS